MLPERTGQEKPCAQFGIGGVISPEKPWQWTSEILRTAEGTGFT
jgi:hypothetical protein